MKIGDENRTKVLTLAGLVLVALYLVYSNVLSPGPSSASRTGSSVTGMADVPGVPDTGRSEPKAPVRPASPSRNLEFHPKVHSKKPEEQIDIRAVDPTLRLDLLAKVQQVPPAGGERDLFQILKYPPGQAPALPKQPEPLVSPVLPPAPPPSMPKVEAPPPPPIPLKYYGICTERVNGKRTAYFLDNDEILQAGEGSTLKGRYRIVQIRPTEVVVEDLQFRRQQSLKLEPEGMSG